ncbi:MAG TPA: CPBP family intramembrane glutamic endopeptidase [Polyangiaceae bacterium]|nr:CPBP family intramembrane glutamic endopeptidase [Polyangiaceae bacterium]
MKPEAERFLREGSGPLDDLALTLPVFVGYHLGVVFLPMRNAADMVTRELTNLAKNDLGVYSLITITLGFAFAGILLILGRRQSLRAWRFLLVGLEGILYAVAMRVVAGYIVGRLHLGFDLLSHLGFIPDPSTFRDAAAAGAAASEPGVIQPLTNSAFAGAIMSLGAGFYEELVFRVVLFGLGFRLFSHGFPATAAAKRGLFAVMWAVLCALAFSGWHYVGEFGDPFEVRSFVFRWVCGLVFTLIYAFRGFAPAVWTHALYDLWIMVF